MKELRALTPEEFERAAERLRNPPPGGRIEAAVKFGIHTLGLIERLRLTPAERARRLQETSILLEKVRGTAPPRA